MRRRAHDELHASPRAAVALAMTAALVAQVAALTTAVRTRLPVDGRKTSYGLSNGRHADIHITQVMRPKSPSRAAFGAPSLRPDLVPTYRANLHYTDMQRRTLCRTPRPAVVDVQRLHHNASVEYLPPCTVLHRCDREAGCCGRGSACQPHRVEYVDLYFYATPVVSNRSAAHVIRLTFANHTLCECREDLEAARDRRAHWWRPGASAASGRPADALDALDTAGDTDDRRVGTGDDDNDIDGDDQWEEEFRCQRCPMPFSARILPMGHCACDCFDRDRECLSIKKGRRRMEELAARCVLSRECNVPTCSTGSFDARHRRCPTVAVERRTHRRRHHRHHHQPPATLVSSDD